MNVVTLVGRRGRDAETRHTASGTSVTNFSLATNRRVKGEDEADWHDIVLWKGENVAPYLTKGTQVAVMGRLQTRKFEGSDGSTKFRTEVHCDPFGLELLGGKQDKTPSAAPQQQSIVDDDAPF